MKYIFVVPIMRYYFIPIPGISSLISILEREGVECEYLNLDAEYFEYLDSEKVLLYNNRLKIFYKNKEYLKYPKIYQEILYSSSKEIIKYLFWIRKNINNFDRYKTFLKNDKLINNYVYFYYYTTLALIIKKENIINLCSKVYEEEEKIFSINVEDILFLFNSKINNFKDFYEEKVKEIIDKNPNVVGIQILKYSELISGLMFAYMIKQKDKNIHVNIGGSYFSDRYVKINNLKELFGVFFDSISIGDSTKTVKDIVRYKKGEIPISDICNLLYVENNKLRFKQEKEKENINLLPYQNFVNCRKEDYLIPELILPVRASMTNSCYWGKCIYCNCSGGERRYSLMSVERFTNEIEYLSKKYNTKYFAFWDNSIHPNYISRVADILIKKKLNIKYNFYARLEKEFSLELLKKIKKSGCIAIHWGLDSCSQKLLDYINKGINIETAKRVLKDSNKAGILNNIYLMFGLPSETIEDMYENLKFIQENCKNIDNVINIGRVEFPNSSIMGEKYEYYKSQINYSSEYVEKRKEIAKEIDKIMKTISFIFLHPQWEYLYVAKHGKIKFNIIRSIIYYYLNTKNNILKRVIDKYFEYVITKTAM